MYLSRVKLDVTKRDTLKALSYPNMFHGAIENCFGGERKRNLWRLDPLGGYYYLLILSQDRPSCGAIIRQFGYDGDEWETKDYSSLIDRVRDGSEWRFRITANPTRSSLAKMDTNGRGTVHAHITAAFQEKWLLDRAKKNGFLLCEDNFAVIHSQWYSFRKFASTKNLVTLLSVTYEGILKVTDSDAFRKVLLNGIGRGKAYGQGLLTIVRI